MGELVFYLLLLITIPFINLYYQNKAEYREKRIKQKRHNFFKNTPYFTINLIENVDVEGFYNEETIPVDVYDKKIDDGKYTDYSNQFELSNKFHKNKAIKNFTSNMIVKFTHNSKNYKFKLKFPIDRVNISMKLYLEKYTKVYVLDACDDIKEDKFYQYFFIDLRFLELKNIDYEELGRV